MQGKSAQKILFLWLPVLVWAGLIFFLSSRQGLSIGEGAVDLWTRKPAHIGEYAILFLLIFRTIRGSFGKIWSARELYLGAGVLTFLYAATDEIHQLFVPTRAGKIEDLGFDLLGILTGVLLIQFYFRDNQRKTIFD